MKKHTAFTLVEILIVIAVFGIWILAVLHWMTQSLRNESNADTQIKSSFFAREWIELMFNLRDANYYKELPWNCIFKDDASDELSDENDNPFCKWYFWSGESNNILKIWIWSGKEYIHIETWSLGGDFDYNFKTYQIYLHTWNILNNSTWFIYNHEKNEKETWFARYLVITWILADQWKIDSDKLLKIESHVLYKKWALTGEKVMETFIWNYEF